MSTIRAVGISGSLRKGSYNSALLAAAGTLLPTDMTLEILEIGDLPLYEESLYQSGACAPARRLREKIAAADALVIATPEYNYSVSGVLKNAIDWASRPPNVPLLGKPTAIMGASGGLLGTARAQYHLRQIGVFLDLRFVNKPEVMVGQAASKFDAAGRLTDETARKLVGDLMAALRALTLQLRKA